MASRGGNVRVRFTAETTDLSRGVTRAKRELDGLGRESSGVEKRFRLFGDAAEAVGESISGLSLRMGAFGGSLGTAVPAIAVATPALVALGGAATAAAGSLSAAAAGAGALGTGLAASLVPVLVVGKQVTSRFEAIKTAYDAVKNAQDAGAKTATASAAAQTAAARQIAGAERALEGAHRSVALAQENLTEARARARREVVDLRLAVEGSAISEERATIALQDAWRELQRARDEGDVSAMRRAEADVDSARLGLKEARIERGRAQEDAKSGTDTVVDAQRQLADARRQVADAERSVGEAHADSAAAVAAVSTSAAAADVALGKLSKAERAAVKTFGRLAELQDTVLGGASDRIILAFSGAVERVAPILETLAKPFDRLGGAIADVITRASNALTDPKWSGALRTFVDSATGLIGPFSRIFGSIANIIRDVATAALPLVKDAVKSVADSFGDLDRNATQSKIRDVVRELVDHTRSWWDLTREVAELVFQVFNTGAADGKSLVDSLTDVVRKWNEWLGTEEGQRKMRDFFKDSAKLVRDLARIVGFFGGAAIEASVVAIDAFEKIRRPLRLIGLALKPITMIALPDFVGAWRTAKSGVEDAVTAMAGLASRIGAAMAGILKDIPPLALKAGGAIGKAIINGIIAGVKATPGKLKDAIGDAIKGGLNAAKSLIPGVGDVAEGFNSQFAASLGGGSSLGGFTGAGLQTEARQGLSFIQSRFGGVSVSSGRRSPEENARVGGAANSDHLTGLALDLVPSEGWTAAGTARLDKIAAWARKSPLIRFIGWRGVPGHGPGDHLHLSFVDRVAGDVAMVGGKLKAFGGKVRGTGDVTSDRRIIQSAAAGGGIDPSILYGVWGAESNFSHGPGPVSSAGAIGPFQFMPGTASSLGVNPQNFRSAAFGAGRYLGMYKGRGTSGMLAAYNAGPAGNPNNAETRAYIPRVLAFAKRWGGKSGGGGGGGGTAVGTAGGGGAGLPSQAGGNRGFVNPKPVAVGLRPGTAADDDPFANMPSGSDFIDRDTALAALTPDTKDDFDAAKGAVAFWQQALKTAGVTADPRDDTAAAQGLKQALDALDSLTKATEEANRLQQQRDDLQREQVDNQRKILQLAQQSPQILAVVIAAVNGDIGGRVGLGFSTPGYAGAPARY